MESEPHRQHLHGFARVWQMRSFFDIDDWALRAKVTLGLSGRSAMSMVLAMERSDSASDQTCLQGCQPQQAEVARQPCSTGQALEPKAPLEAVGGWGGVGCRF